MAPWYLDPAALAIIESCLANRPKQVYREEHYPQTTDRWTEWTGTRVERLHAIWLPIAERLLAEGDASGDDSALKAHYASGTAEDVLNALLGGTAKPFLGGYAPKGELHREIRANVERALARKVAA